MAKSTFKPDYNNPPKIISGNIEEKVSVARIRNHPANARKGDIESIAESIKENGFYGHLTVQKSTGYILAGNHRFLAGISLGMLDFPVEWLDIDDNAALKILAVDNSTSDKADYVLEKQAELLATIASLCPTGLKGSGYQPKHLEALKAKLAEKAASDAGSGDGGGRRKGEGDDVHAIILTFASPSDQESEFERLQELGLAPRKTVLNERTKLALGKSG